MKNLYITGVLLGAFALEAATVVLPEKPSAFEQTAARELATHLTKAYGKNVPVLPENNPGKNGPFLYVGNTRLAAANQIDSSKFAKEEHLVKTVSPDRLIVTGGSTRGVIYGAFETLEKLYGVLWLDDEFTYIPGSKLAQFPANLKLQGKPDFLIRCIHTYWSGNSYARQLKAIRNRQNHLHDQKHHPALKSYGLERIYGSPRSCHTYYDYTKDWGKEDEVCFSMNERGKRIRSTSAHGPAQICWTNPRTAELFTKKLREFIKADQKKYGKPYPAVYVISDNDNGYKCHCKNCLAGAKKYQGYTGIVIEFTNRIARNIAQEYPYVRIQMSAYKDIYDVPQGIMPEPNVWINLGVPRDSMRPFDHPNNKKALQVLKKWGEKKRITVWDWWILYYNTGMGLFYDAIPDVLRRYKQMEVPSMMVEQEEPMTNSFYALRLWLGQRFMVNTRLDLQTETRRFMNAYYGPAAPVMEELLNYIRKRQSEEPGVLQSLVPQQRHDLDDAFFAACGKFIDRALALAQTPMQKKHIRHERFALDYGNLRRNRTKVGVEPKIFASRMREDFALCAPLYWTKPKRESFAREFERALGGLTANIPQITLNGYNIHHDLSWPFLNKFRKSVMAEDPDAAGGKAVKLEDFDKYGGRLVMGFYNTSFPKKSKNLVVKNIPQDEKYHLYHIGKIEIGPKGYFWAHASWNIQIEANQYFNPAYNPSGDPENEYELFISAKAEGPNYVKGSKRKSALWIDRIILARKKK